MWWRNTDAMGPTFRLPLPTVSRKVRAVKEENYRKEWHLGGYKISRTTMYLLVRNALGDGDLFFCYILRLYMVIVLAASLRSMTEMTQIQAG